MKRAILLLTFASLASAVTVFRVDPQGVVTTAGTAPPGGFPALYAVASATIALCSDSACITPAIAYADAAGAVPCPSYAPVTIAGTALCTSLTGPQGQFGFWLVPGVYYYTVTFPNGRRYGPFPITSGTASAPVGTSSFQQFISDGTSPFAGSFRADPLMNAPYFEFPAQFPGGSLAVGANSIIMSPVPPGVNGTDTLHRMYVAGGVGTPEACLITGGSGTAGQSAGGISLTCANVHTGPWYIVSATAGQQEAVNTCATVGGCEVRLAAASKIVYWGTYNNKPGVAFTCSMGGYIQRVSQGGTDTIGCRISVANGANLDYVYKSEGSNTRWTGFEVNGNRANQSGGLGHIIWINNPLAGTANEISGFVISHMGIHEHYGIGINVTAGVGGAILDQGIIFHTSVRDGNSHNVNLNSVNDWTVDGGSSFGGCFSTGCSNLVISGGSGHRVGVGTVLDTAEGHALYLFHAQDFIGTGMRLEYACGSGAYIYDAQADISSPTNAVTISDSVIRYNSRYASGDANCVVNTWDGIHIVGNARNVIIHGNHIYDDSANVYRRFSQRASIYINGTGTNSAFNSHLTATDNTMLGTIGTIAAGNLTGVSVATGIATATLTAATRLTNAAYIIVQGSATAALNEYRPVTSNTPTTSTFTFATSAPDGVYTDAGLEILFVNQILLNTVPNSYVLTNNQPWVGFSNTAATAIASASTISPTHPFQYVSGTGTISSITFTPSFTDAYTFVPTGAWSTNTGGNIGDAFTATVGKPVACTFNARANKFYCTY